MTTDNPRHLLIVTAWYHPLAHPRAHRWTAIAEHWAAQGHHVCVLSSKQAGCPEQENRNGVQVMRTGHAALHELVLQRLGLLSLRGRVHRNTKPPSALFRFFYACYQFFWKKAVFPDDALVWYLPAQKKIFQLLENQHFDQIITVSFPFTTHCLGIAAQRKFGPKMPHWTADIGDPFSLPALTENAVLPHQKLRSRWEERLLRAADKIVVTTPALKEKYADVFEGIDPKKIALAGPIYAEESKGGYSNLAPNAEQQNYIDHPITVAYFGALYAPVRPPDVFVDLLKMLSLHRPDVMARVTFHFYGEMAPYCYLQLINTPNVVLHGLLSRENCQKTMQKADVLLNIGNKSTVQLPSKAIDYWAAGKPVLHLNALPNRQLTDPFSDFFKGHPAFFEWQSSAGQQGEAALAALANWLFSEKADVPRGQIEQKIKAHQVGHIAAIYLIPGNLPKYGNDAQSGE